MRRTGKTQRMLEDALASDAENVVVVGATMEHAKELYGRVVKMLPSGSIERRTRDSIWTSDGRCFRFRTAGNGRDAVYEAIAGMHPTPKVFWDHYVQEVAGG